MPPAPPRVEVVAAVATLYQAGWPVQAIAILTNRPTLYVFRCLERAGVKRRGRW